jgi:cbb3-type cytochrome oxidase subunit 3
VDKTKNMKEKKFPSNLKKMTVLIMVFLLFFPFFTKATGVSDAVTGLKAAADKGLGTKKISDLPTAIGKIVGTGLSFIGVIFFLLMIYGGMLWMLAKGNESEVTKAKELITAAVIGLVIVLSAYAITSFVSSNLVTSTK